MLSIIIPVYNVELYLHRCIVSVLNNSYKDIEVLLVDDGSTDRTGSICDDFAASDPRVRVLHQKNAGTSGARNNGLSMVHGEWITFVDGDDYILPNIYTEALSKAEALNLDAVCFGCTTIRDGHPKKDIKYSSEKVFSATECMEELFAYRLDNAPWNKVYRRALFDGIQFPLHRVYEDAGTIYKALFQAKRIGYTLNCDYQYSIRMGSNIHNKTLDPKGRYDNFLNHCERITFCAENKLPALSAETRALHTAIAAMTAFLATNESPSSQRYQDVESFLRAHLHSKARQKSKPKQRFLLWSYFHCRWMYRRYACSDL